VGTIYAINLLAAVTLNGAYDGAEALQVGLQGHVICCSSGGDVGYSRWMHGSGILCQVSYRLFRVCVTVCVL